MRVLGFEGDLRRDFDGDCGGGIEDRSSAVGLLIGLWFRGGENRMIAAAFSLSEELPGREGSFDWEGQIGWKLSTGILSSSSPNMRAESEVAFFFVGEILVGLVSPMSSKIARAFICFDISSGSGFLADSCCFRGVPKNFFMLGNSSSDSSSMSLAEPHHMLSSTSSSSTSSQGLDSTDIGFRFCNSRANGFSRWMIVRRSFLLRSRLCSFSAASLLEILPKQL